MRARNNRTRPGWVVGAAAVLLMSACAGSSEAGSGEETSAAIVDEAKANVKAAFAAIDYVPPAGGPKAAEGVKLFYLVSGASTASGTMGIQTVKSAVEELGWELRIFDGEFSPDKQQEGLRQAVAWGADAVLNNGVDCPGNETALGAVRQAGIPIVAIASADCDEGENTGKPLFDAVPKYPDADSPHDYFAALGAIQADWIIADSDGKAKVIEFAVPDFLVTAAFAKGFEDRFKECAGCELSEVVTVGIEDFGPEIQDKAEQALLKNPDATHFAIAYDDLMTFGIASAVKNSGRNDDLGVIAGDGYPANIDLIRSNGGQDAGYAYDFRWEHMAGIDTVNRVLQGEEPGTVGPPVVLYDADTNLPPEGEGYVSGGDFEGAFLSNWGV